MTLTRRYFTFFEELEQHNDRDWFAANKARYVADVEAPFLSLLAELEPRLHHIAPHIRCSPDKTGGSMMRIHRDTRFSRDKAPYKNHLGAMMLHASQARGPGMLGYVLHLGAGERYLGAGLSAPEPDALARVRAAIVEQAPTWRGLREGLSGEQRKRLPAGLPADHEHDADLRRVSFFKTVPFRRADVTAKDFASTVARAAEELEPLLGFLARALHLPW